MGKGKTVKESCYLTILPTTGYSGSIDGFNVTKVTKTMPRVPEGAPTIHLRIEIPLSVLEPFEALLVVPEKDLTVIPAIVEEIPIE